MYEGDKHGRRKIKINDIEDKICMSFIVAVGRPTEKMITLT